MKYQFEGNVRSPTKKESNWEEDYVDPGEDDDDDKGNIEGLLAVSQSVSIVIVGIILTS